MHYEPVRGTRVGVHTIPERKPAKVPCPRCGRRRYPTHEGPEETRTGLCRDCKDVLSPEEIEIWRIRLTATAS